MNVHDDNNGSGGTVGTGDGTTGASSNVHNRNNENNKNNCNINDGGIWIGIDLGTTNSTCAVWDSTRGSPKWIRLPTGVATPNDAERRSGKVGRIMPSIVAWKDSNSDLQSTSTTTTTATGTKSRQQPYVGQQVYQLLDHQQTHHQPTDHVDNIDFSVFHSVKRLLGKHYTDLDLDSDWIQSLDYDIRPMDDDDDNIDDVGDRRDNDATSSSSSSSSLKLVGKTGPSRSTGTDTDTIITTPQEVLSQQLQAIRRAAQTYLAQYHQKNNLRVPGGTSSGVGDDASFQNSSKTTNNDNFMVTNVIVGIPAHYSHRHTRLLTEACHQAGFSGHVGFLLESTAAAMAYGLTLQESPSPQQRSSTAMYEPKSTEQLTQSQLQTQSSIVMVIDMGGGTTDITIIGRNSGDDDDDNGGGSTNKISSNENPSSVTARSDSSLQPTYSSLPPSYNVLVTIGDERLGGEDIDQAMVNYCLDRYSSSLPSSSLSSSSSSIDRVQNSGIQHRSTDNQINVDIDLQRLRKDCRKAKEALCMPDSETGSSEETIVLYERNHHSSINKTRTVLPTVSITQAIFEEIIDPWLSRARTLIGEAVDGLRQWQQSNDKKPTNRREDLQLQITEVVLVGGTTRVPAIRRMIQDAFPKIELSTSLSPFSSTAQGLAIQAALSSKMVPLHELKSALMLDCVPHAIGILLDSSSSTSTFVEIIERNQPLPAHASAKFQLASKQQPGVTFRVVERVGPNTYEPMSKEDDSMFTFLLRRLSKSELERLDVRSIEVGMAVDTDGKFIVSIFDELDPEQVRKKQRYEDVVKGNDAVVGELGYINDLFWAEADITTEQVFLIGTLVGLIILYLAVRIAYTDLSVEGGTIL